MDDMLNFWKATKESTLASLQFNALNPPDGCPENNFAVRLLSCLSNLGRLRDLTLHIGKSVPVASKQCVDAVKKSGTLYSAQFLKDTGRFRYDAVPCLCDTKPLLDAAESRLVEAYCQRNMEMKGALQRSFPASKDALATGEAVSIVETVPHADADAVAEPEQPNGQAAPALFVVANQVPTMAFTNILLGLGLGSITIGPSETKTDRDERKLH